MPENRSIVRSDEQSLPVDLVRLDRTIPVAGCVGSRKRRTSASAQRPAAQNRISAAGRSGGRLGGKSAKRAPQAPRGSSRYGQSPDKRTSRSSRRISAPNLTASRARRYAPARLHASQRKRTSTYGKSTNRR